MYYNITRFKYVLFRNELIKMFFKNLKRNLNRNYFINETNLSRKLTSEQYSLLIAPIRLIKVLCFLTIISPLLTGLDFVNQAARGNLIFFLTWFIIFLIILQLI